MVLLLVPLALLLGQSPLGTFDNPNTGLQSAGIRGTIDPGGYAASAEIKTRTEFFQQLADLQVSALRSAWSGPSVSGRAKPAIDAMKSGDLPPAVSLLQELVRSRSNASNHQLLALAYEGVGQLAAAVEQFRIAAALHPTAASFFAQGAALLLAGDITPAETVFNQAAKQPGNAALLGRLGLAAAQLQHSQVRQAIDGFLDAATTHPHAPAPFTFLAITLHTADPANLAHCVSALHSLLQTAPQNAWAHYALSRALAAQAAPPDRILDQLKTAIAIHPQFADAHFRLAEIYAQNGSLAAAISEYTTALAHAGPWPEAHYRLAQLYIRSGQAALAKEQFALYRQTQARQKNEIESGRVPLRFNGDNLLPEQDPSK